MLIVAFLSDLIPCPDTLLSWVVYFSKLLIYFYSEYFQKLTNELNLHCCHYPLTLCMIDYYFKSVYLISWDYHEYSPSHYWSCRNGGQLVSWRIGELMCLWPTLISNMPHIFTMCAYWFSFCSPS